MTNTDLKHYIALGLINFEEVTLFISLRRIYSEKEALELVFLTR